MRGAATGPGSAAVVTRFCGCRERFLPPLAASFRWGAPATERSREPQSSDSFLLPPPA